ncbi:MAG: hypothetical protein KatS3mg104_0136 [Phycisphaerae bacterium]|nr:MAG: hypothetical protein KatS3mg104_0136 [Phycisphaerae bacterium]
MYYRWMFGFAMGVYLFVVGCAWVSPTPVNEGPSGRGSSVSVSADSPRKMVEGLPYRAIGMQIQRIDWMDRYKQSIDEIAAVGADTVKFVVDARQENGGSSRIYMDIRTTPTPAQLSDLILYAKKKNLRVILMPIVLLDKPRGNEWRGKIDPEGSFGWDNWWDSYRDMLWHYSWIAQSTGVDILVIGSELVSTESQTDQWLTTIEKVRQWYKGKITYSANWDHYTAVRFWDKLDFVGMNSYWKLGDDRDVPIERIVENWRKIQSEVLPFVEKTGKPLLLTEVGWCSMANMAHQPWDYTKSEAIAPTDPDLQRKLYEGFFEAWYGNPLLGGLSIWEWTPEPDSQDVEGQKKKKRGYTPEGKPAEQVLKTWFAKPWTTLSRDSGVGSKG